MKTFCFISLLLISQGVFGTWVNLNTGIADELTGVVFWGNLGMLSGHHGLYYTSTGGSGPTSWTRFEITGNSVDSLRYNQSRFYHCYSDPIGGTNLVLACGQDTVSGRAIIMSVDLSSLSYTMVFEGPPNSLLRHIDFSPYGTYYASGNDGLLVKFNTATLSPTIVSTGYSNDFYGIDFYGSRLWIAAEDTILAGSHSNLSINVYDFPTPGHKHYGISMQSNTYGYSAGNFYHKYKLTNPNEFTNNSNYDFGPLNGRCIISKGNTHFVGTDHGIFRSGSNYQFLEWQPSSQQYEINDFWFQGSNGTDFYACGANGVLLKSSSNGGDARPYTTLNVEGGCVGSTKTINGITGTSTNCSWYINGTLEHTACYSFSHQFQTTGIYQIDLIGTSAGGISDTSTQFIHIVDPPITTLATAVTDSILCKTSAAEITISQSQPNVYYTMRKLGNFQAGSFGNSPPGNGNSLTYMTQPIESTGTYYLLATSTLAPCSSVLSDYMDITVEQTTASFHPGTINVEPGETVTLFETSRDAQHFQWDFGPSASIASSTLDNPTLSFSQYGQEQVDLIASSVNGCHDTLHAAGPYVYQVPSPSDSCWTLVNKGIDPTWSGMYYPDISYMIPVEDGFLTSGYFDSTVFASHLGTSYVDPVKSGGYLAKHSYDGALKWFVYSKQTDLNERENVDYISADSSGNIYITGNTDGYFFDNARDSVDIGTGIQNGFYLNKLNAQGELLWTLKSKQLRSRGVYVDPDQNIILVGGGVPGMPVGPDVILNINGVDTDTLNFAPFNGFRIIKLSPNGDVLWFTTVSYSSASSSISDLFPVITFDSANHFYISGNVQYTPVELFSVGNSTPVVLPYKNRIWFFAAQYSLDGQFQWVIDSETSGGSGVQPTRIKDMFVDSIGNMYAVGSNNCSHPSYQQTFHNADGTVTSTDEGEYFLAKINPQGICEWIRGAGNTYYGYGYEVLERNGQISVIGQLGQNSGSYVSTAFSSASGDSLPITIGRADYFLAQYDVNGNLLSVALNGDNGSLVSGEYFSGFFQMADGSYYLSRNMRSFMSNYENFGNAIDTTYGWDGTITRFYPECGIHSIVPSCLSGLSVQVALTESICGTYSSPSGMILTQSGIYQDTISPTFGCDTVFTIDLTILADSLPTQPVITASGGLTFCQGDSVILSGPTGFDYLWSSGDTTMSITVHTSGNYEVSIQDSNGCSSVASSPVDVQVNPPPSQPLIVASGPTTFCEGDSVSLVGPSGFSYIWSNGSQDQSITVLDSGTFSLVVVDSSLCQSISSPPISVMKHPKPITPLIHANGLTTFCEGDSVLLSTSTNHSDYLWSNGDTDSVSWISQSGSFTLQVENMFGCQSDMSNNISVTVNPLPSQAIISPNGPIEFCEGDSVILSAPVGYSYLWSTGETTPNIIVTQPEMVDLMVIDANQCSSMVSQVLVVVVNDLPAQPQILSSGPTVFCEEDSVILSGPSGYAYSWSNGSLSQSIVVTANGTFTLSVQDGNGCISPPSASMAVTTHPLPPSPTVFASGPLSFCQGDSVTLSGPMGFAYQWSTGDTTASIVLTMSDSISLAVIDSNQCLSPFSVPTSISVEPLPPQPVISPLGMAEFCEGDSLSLFSSFADSYQWSTGDTSQSIWVNMTGFYSVEVGNLLGCLSERSDSVFVQVNPIPSQPSIIELGNDSLMASTSASIYQWFFNGILLPDTSQIIVATQSGNYSVIAIEETCESIVSAQVGIGSTNINELFAGGKLRIYPNPSKGLIVIEGDLIQARLVKILVVDTRGREIIRLEMNTIGGSIHQTINLTMHSEGVYFMMLDAGIDYLNKQLIISR